MKPSVARSWLIQAATRRSGGSTMERVRAVRTKLDTYIYDPHIEATVRYWSGGYFSGPAQMKTSAQAMVDVLLPGTTLVEKRLKIAGDLKNNQGTAMTPKTQRRWKLSRGSRKSTANGREFRHTNSHTVQTRRVRVERSTGNGEVGPRAVLPKRARFVRSFCLLLELCRRRKPEVKDRPRRQ